MINLTEMEKIFLAAMVRSEYGDDGHMTWEWSVAPKEIAKTSRPGVIGSLVKKGIIYSDEYDTNEFVLGFTEAGREVQAQFVAERDSND